MSKIQHKNCEPYGAGWVDERTDEARSKGFSSRYRFTCKERDAESGMEYIGARYYWSGGGLWLSVDPLADNYPFLSPYVYGACSPVVLVDADGREVYVLGSAAEEFVRHLSTPNFKVSLDENRRLIYTGKAKTPAEKMLQPAIDSKDVEIYINAVNSRYIDEEFVKRFWNEYDVLKDLSTTFGVKQKGGAFFLGAQKKGDKFYAFQQVSPSWLSYIERSHSIITGEYVGGKTFYHEVTEPFQAAIYLKERNLMNIKAGLYGINADYSTIHNRAAYPSGIALYDLIDIRFGPVERIFLPDQLMNGIYIPKYIIIFNEPNNIE